MCNHIDSVVRASLLTLLIAFPRSADAFPPTKNGTDNGQAATAPVSAAEDTSMLTGSGVNTKAWPIDRPVPGGVMRKLPGHRDWVFVRAMSDAEMAQRASQRQTELLRQHGSEPRDIEIAIPDSLTLHKLVRFQITATCAPPCTLQARVLYRELPRLQRDSLFFWGLGERKTAPALKNGSAAPTPQLARPGPGK